MADCCNSTLKIGDPCRPVASTIDSIDPFAHSFAFNDVQTWIPQSFSFQNPVELHPPTISKQLLQELLRRWILPEFDGLHQGLGSGDAMAHDGTMARQWMDMDGLCELLSHDV
jgi:hypothetical protein